MDNERKDWQDGEVKVVMNHEEQYSIWPAHKEAPSGWKEVGVSGDKKKCLDYINENWNEMQPLSLRIKMEKVQSAK